MRPARARRRSGQTCSRWQPNARTGYVRRRPLLHAQACAARCQSMHRAAVEPAWPVTNADDDSCAGTTQSCDADRRLQEARRARSCTAGSECLSNDLRWTVCAVTAPCTGLVPVLQRHRKRRARAATSRGTPRTGHPACSGHRRVWRQRAAAPAPACTYPGSQHELLAQPSCASGTETRAAAGLQRRRVAAPRRSTDDLHAVHVQRQRRPARPAAALVLGVRRQTPSARAASCTAVRGGPDDVRQPVRHARRPARPTAAAAGTRAGAGRARAASASPSRSTRPRSTTRRRLRRGASTSCTQRARACRRRPSVTSRWTPPRGRRSRRTPRSRWRAARI